MKGCCKDSGVTSKQSLNLWPTAATENRSRREPLRYKHRSAIDALWAVVLDRSVAEDTVLERETMLTGSFLGIPTGKMACI